MSDKLLLIIVYIYFHWFLTAQLPGTCDQSPLSKILMGCILKLAYKFIHIFFGGVGNGDLWRDPPPNFSSHWSVHFLKYFWDAYLKVKIWKTDCMPVLVFLTRRIKFIYFFLLPRLFHKYILKRLVVFLI